MATESFELTCELDAPPKDVYHAWMDTKRHSDFTGAPATVDARVGGGFTAWDSYIDGVIIDLEPDRRIVQEWRTQEFPPDGPPSRLEIVLEPVDPGNTLLRLIHTEIPEGQGERYRKGWEDNYFGPLRKYFGPKEAPAEVEEREEEETRVPAARTRAAAEEKPAARAAPKRAAAAAKPTAAKRPAKKKAAPKKAAGAKRATRGGAKKAAGAKKTAKGSARKAGGARKAAGARKATGAKRTATSKRTTRKSAAKRPARGAASAKRATGSRKGSSSKGSRRGR